MKTRILLILLLVSSFAFAQIPTDDTKRYLFVNGSIQNDANPGNYNLAQSGSAPTIINGQDGGVDNAVQMLNTKFTAGLATPTNYVNTNQQVSISAWIKIQYASGATRGLFRQTHTSGSLYGYDFYYSGTTLKMYTRHGCYNGTCDNTNTLSSPTSINDNQWHHVVFSVYKENNGSQERYVQELYIDGSLDSSYNFPWVYAPTGNNNGVRLWSVNNNLLIGQQPSGQYYEGAMDDIRYYERGLTENEVTYLSGGTPPPVVNIPDPNFKSWLLNNSTINTNSDTEIQVSEAESVTGLMQIIGLGIVDWTGIEAFIGITGLSVDSNPATSIDLSHNINLQTLQYDEAFYLTSLVLPNSNALQNLTIRESLITTIDLSSYTNLVYVIVRDANLLTEFDLRNNNNNLITYFDSRDTPNLTCIYVDNKTNSQTNWSNIDGANNFVENDAECATLGTENFKVGTEFSIHPNPTSNVLNIKMNQGFNKAEIYNLQGQKVLESKNKSVNVSKLSSGLYLIQIEDTNGTSYTKRFIKN